MFNLLGEVSLMDCSNRWDSLRLPTPLLASGTVDGSVFTGAELRLGAFVVTETTLVVVLFELACTIVFEWGACITVCVRPAGVGARVRNSEWLVSFRRYVGRCAGVSGSVGTMGTLPTTRRAAGNSGFFGEVSCPVIVDDVREVITNLGLIKVL
jgi:hypothetical protein